MKRLASLLRSVIPGTGAAPFGTAVLVTLMIVFAPALVQGTDVFNATLAFEAEALDLDTGTVIDTALVDEADGTDIRIAYNALRLDAAVVVPGATEGVELAFVKGVPFGSVTTDSLAGLVFSPYGVDEPFSPFDTVVVRTDTGAVFKLGNASESDTEVTFDYAPL